VTTPSDSAYREIPLTKGQFASVDACDYDSLSQYKWYAQWNPNTRSFYAARELPRSEGKRQGVVYMHRQVLGLSKEDARHGDHVLHSTLDNRRFVDGKENLRIATRLQNRHNSKARKDSVSGIKGVTPFGDKWKAELTVSGKWHYLGLHDTKESAAEAIRELADSLCGEFACRL
jgi:hypothetical protein